MKPLSQLCFSSKIPEGHDYLPTRRNEHLTEDYDTQFSRGISALCDITMGWSDVYYVSWVEHAKEVGEWPFLISSEFIDRLERYFWTTWLKWSCPLRRPLKTLQISHFYDVYSWDLFKPLQPWHVHIISSKSHLQSAEVLKRSSANWNFLVFFSCLTMAKIS